MKQYTPEEKFKTSVGGQALIEGIMMRGPKKMALAVRKPDGEIYIETKELSTHTWQKWPLVRGVCAFVESLVSGYQCLMKSAEISMGEEEFEQEESRFDKWVNDTFGDKAGNFIMTLAAIAGGALALVLFLVIPTALTGLLGKFVELGLWRAWIEGILKIVMLVGYMALVSRMKDIKRMFAYHGAEHKTIACYEAGLELKVENIRRCSRFHPRCGTSFLLIVVLLSILVGALITSTNTLLRIALKLLLLPVVMGVGYEIIKFCGRHNNVITRAISAPGLWLQHITTNEPDDSMIECAIAAVQPVLPDDPNEGKW